MKAGLRKTSASPPPAAGFIPQPAIRRNVDLVCRTAADYRFPDGVGGILATGALTYEPEYDKVIERGTKALAPGRRWVVLDYKMPDNRLRHLAPLFIALGSAFGVSRALMERHVRESVQRHLRNTRMQEVYDGFVYIVSGEASYTKAR